MGAVKPRLRLSRRPWLTLALGLVIAALFGALWLTRASVQYLSESEPVPEGQPAVGEKATFRLRGMSELEVIPDFGQAKAPVPNATFVAVLFDFEGTATDNVTCMVHLLGQDRVWLTDRTASVDDWGYESSCDGGRGTVLKLFEIPASAVEEVRGVRILSGGETLILGGQVKPQ